jgi:hypothetical protein
MFICLLTPMSQRALFEGLVSDTEGRLVAVAYVGGEAQYVVNDGGFKFHISSETVDRQVLSVMREQITDNRQAVTEGTLKMLGQDDLFSKAMIDASLNNIDEHFDRLIASGLPEDARTYMGMLGFKIVINYHGDVVQFDQPAQIAPEDE